MNFTTRQILTKAITHNATVFFVVKPIMVAFAIRGFFRSNLYMLLGGKSKTDYALTELANSAQSLVDPLGMEYWLAFMAYCQAAGIPREQAMPYSRGAHIVLKLYPTFNRIDVGSLIITDSSMTAGEKVTALADWVGVVKERTAQYRFGPVWLARLKRIADFNELQTELEKITT